MCIVQGTDGKISKTRIFVAPSERRVDAKGKEVGCQLTVYANHVAKSRKIAPIDSSRMWTPSREPQAGGMSSSASGPTPAMILPAVSFDQGRDVLPVDMSQCADVFDVLDSAFPTFSNNSYALDGRLSKARGILEVVKVGSYDVSIVPTRKDFDRLSRETFTLDPNVAQLFADRYPDDFAFVVCRLRQNEKFHPIAYLSALSADGNMFVPAYHYHGKVEDKPDWDHAVYVAGSNGVLRNDRLAPLLPARKTTPRFAEESSANSVLGKLARKLPVPLDLDRISVLSKTVLEDIQGNFDLLAA